MNPTPQVTESHIDRPHAEFGPSGLKYVRKCAGFKGRDGTSEAAEKGNRIHFALETGDISGLQSEEEVAIHDQCLADLNNELAELEALTGIKPTVDQEVRLHIILDHTETFGTADIVAVAGSYALLHDHKTGVSKIDCPPDNDQSTAYAVGVFQMFPEVDTIKAVFSVPVRGELLSGFYYRSDLPKYTADLSQVICRATRVRALWYTGEQDVDNLSPSVDCRFCEFEGRCPALGAVAIDIAKRVKPELVPDGEIDFHNVEDPATAGRLYIVAKIVEKWAAGMKSRAVQMALAGVEFEELHLRSMGSLKKTEDKNSLAQLAMTYGLSLTDIIEAADLTVTQLSSAIHDKAPAGQKTHSVESFEAAAVEAGIVSIGNKRFTLASN
jgi:hypothetical protein